MYIVKRTITATEKCNNSVHKAGDEIVWFFGAEGTGALKTTKGVKGWDKASFAKRLITSMKKKEEKIKQFDGDKGWYVTSYEIVEIA